MTPEAVNGNILILAPVCWATICQGTIFAWCSLADITISSAGSLFLKIEAYTLTDGIANFLNIGYKHAVINMSREPRIALMFTLNGTKDIEKLL